MNLIIRCLFLYLFALIGSPTFAQSNFFHRLELANEISIEIPNQWEVLSHQRKEQIRDAASEIIDNAGIAKDNGEKQCLLAVNAIPEPTGAMIRVSVISPPDYTQADLAEATSDDLELVRVELQNMSMKLAASTGLRKFKYQPVCVEKINGCLALVIAYVRPSIIGPSPWMVKQYKIPRKDLLIEITLSHRKSDQNIWLPILDRVLKSVKF